MTVQTLPTVDSERARIDALDDELRRLVAERIEVSRSIQALRRAAGGPTVEHSREGVVVGRWSEQLGAPGRAIALALLELGRGPL